MQNEREREREKRNIFQTVSKASLLYYCRRGKRRICQCWPLLILHFSALGELLHATQTPPVSKSKAKISYGSIVTAEDIRFSRYSLHVCDRNHYGDFPLLFELIINFLSVRSIRKQASCSAQNNSDNKVRLVTLSALLLDYSCSLSL